MKNLFVVVVLLLIAVTSCKTKQQTQKQLTDSTTGATKVIPKTQGTVSHEYRATGCSTVVIVKKADSATPMILIPITALPDEFDKDGLTIYFNYSLSRIKNPEGCSHGMPAQIKDVSTK